MRLPDRVKHILRRTKDFTLLLALPIYAVLLAGGSFQAQNYIEKYELGKYNRKADAEFVKEFANGVFYLKNKYENKVIFNKKTDNVVTIDLIVADNLKHFYDDENDANDNNDWLGYVENCLRGMNKFSEFEDLDFKINTVEGVLESQFVMAKNGESFLQELRQKLEQERKSDILLYLRSGKLTIGSANVGGVTFVDFPISVINLIKHKERNQIVLAHESGHLFGASHTTSGYICVAKQVFVAVPSFGYIYWGDIMEEGINSLKPQQEWAEQSIEEINKNKYKFK